MSEKTEAKTTKNEPSKVISLTEARAKKKKESRKGGDAFDWFFVAMARKRLGLGHAETCYEKAVAWMDKHKPDDEELKRFRAEAEATLGIKKR